MKIASFVLIISIFGSNAFAGSSICGDALLEIYNQAHPARLTNIQIINVVLAVRSTFKILREDPKMLSKEIANQNRKSGIYSLGFDYDAINAVYHMLGGRRSGLTPEGVANYSSDVPNKEPHWYLREPNIKNDIVRYVDPTADRFTSYGVKPPYNWRTKIVIPEDFDKPTEGALKIINLASQVLYKQGLKLNGAKK